VSIMWFINEVAFEEVDGSVGKSCVKSRAACGDVLPKLWRNNKEKRCDKQFKPLCYLTWRLNIVRGVKLVSISLV
jgi:hypothetical protein